MSAASGVRNRARTPTSRSTSSYPSAGASNMEGRPDFPSTSTMSTDRPARLAVTARAAVTVVLPTPPLPATMTTREVEQNSATSIAPSYEARATTERCGGARGAAALLARSADFAAVAPGAHLGPVDPIRFDDTSFTVAAPLKDVTAKAATLLEFIGLLDGRTFETAVGPVKPSTIKVVEL